MPGHRFYSLGQRTSSPVFCLPLKKSREEVAIKEPATKSTKLCAGLSATLGSRDPEMIPAQGPSFLDL